VNKIHIHRVQYPFSQRICRSRPCKGWSITVRASRSNLWQ